MRQGVIFMSEIFRIGVEINARSAVPAAAQINRVDAAMNRLGASAQVVTSSFGGVSASFGNVVGGFRAGNPVLAAATVAAASTWA